MERVKRTAGQLLALLLSVAVVITGFAAWTTADAFAETDTSVLNIRAVNESGEAVEGIGLRMVPSDEYTGESELDDTDENGCTSLDLIENDVLDDTYELVLLNDDYELLSPVTIVIGASRYTPFVDKVNGEDYTGEVLITVKKNQPVVSADWTAEDFTYGSETFDLTSKANAAKLSEEAWVVTGFSDKGAAKLAYRTDIVIPAQDPEGRTVCGIGKAAFKGQGITAVTLPEGVKASAEGFDPGTAAEGLAERGDFFIGYEAFRNNSIEALALPEGVILIGNYAFAGNKLTSVELPSTLWQIYSGAFMGNAAGTQNPISDLSFAAETDYGMEIDAQAFVYNRVGSVILPENIDTISAAAFMNNNYSSTDKSFGITKMLKFGAVDGARLGYIGHDSSIDSVNISKINKYQSLSSIDADMINGLMDSIAKAAGELDPADPDFAVKAKAVVADAEALKLATGAYEQRQSDNNEKVIEEKDAELVERANTIAEQAAEIEDRKASEKELNAQLAQLKADSAFSVKASATNYKTVVLSWTANKYASSYKVEMKTGKGEWTEVPAGSCSGKSFTVKSAKTGTVYLFRVAAVVKNGDADVVGTAYTAKVKPVLARAAAPSLKGARKAVKATWKAVSGADGYQLSVSTSKTGTKVVKTTSSGKFTKRKLKAKKKYYIKVRAYRTVDGKKVYGSWSQVKSVKTK